MHHHRFRIAAAAALMLTGPAIAFAPDTGAGGGDPHGLTAQHRGGGSYAVMHGDGETVVLDKLTRAEAEAFNDLDADEKPAYVERVTGEREKAEADKEVGGGGPITQTADTQATGGDAPVETDVDPNGPDGEYDVANTSETGGSLMASGVMVTIPAKAERRLVLSAAELARAKGYGYFEISEIEPKE